MKLTTPILAVAAALSLAACVAPDGKTPQVAPETPTPTAGLIDSPTSLNGTWNLIASQCGQADSEGRLVIAANKFDFAGAACTSTRSSVETNFTKVSLSCSGAKQFNRELNLALQPGKLRMTEDSKTLTYYRCPSVKM